MLCFNCGHQCCIISAVLFILRCGGVLLIQRLYLWSIFCLVAFIHLIVAELQPTQSIDFVVCWKPALLKLQRLNTCIYFFPFSFATHSLFMCISACLRGIWTHFHPANMFWHHAGLSVKLQLCGTWCWCQTCLPFFSLNHFSPCVSLCPPVSSSVFP